MNYFALGFGAVALTALGAVDYANQASVAGQAPGTYPASAYFASYGGRMTAMREARAAAAEDKGRDARRSTGARLYLPDAPQGWSRRAWADGDNSVIELAQPGLVANDAPDLLKNFAAKSERAAEKQRDAETWVYQNGNQIVAIRATYTAREGERNLAADVQDTLAPMGRGASGTQTGWGVIGGVAYAAQQADSNDAATPHLSLAGTPFLSLEAQLGFHDEITLTVQSNAGLAATRAILAEVDYDGLNALLTYPLPYIGSAAPTVSPETERQLATVMVDMRQDLLSRRSTHAQAWLAQATSPEGAMKLALDEVMAGLDARGGTAPAFAGQTPQTEANSSADSGKGVFGGFANSVTSFFDAVPTGGASAEQAAPPKRLQLSGGASCLEGSAGRFCRD